MDDHYIAWRQTHDAPGTEYQDGDGPFSFCSYPFLLNPRAKSKLLHTEARFMMNHTVQQVRAAPGLPHSGGEASRRPTCQVKWSWRCVGPASALYPIPYYSNVTSGRRLGGCPIYNYLESQAGFNEALDRCGILWLLS